MNEPLEIGGSRMAVVDGCGFSVLRMSALEVVAMVWDAEDRPTPRWSLSRESWTFERAEDLNNAVRIAFEGFISGEWRPE